MARIRTIKPDFFTSDDICALSPLARLLYIGLWCEADREGRFAWTPKAFRRRYLPDDQTDIEVLCHELLARDLVRLYGDDLAFIPTFLDHQHVNPREAQSVLPAPDSDASARVSDAQVGKEGREGKEGNAATRRVGVQSAHRMPDDFKPSDEDRAWAAKARPDLTPALLDMETERMRNHANANNRTAHNWGPNWRNWIGKADAAAAPPRGSSTKGDAVTALPPAEPWEQRVRGYKPGGFWKPNDWGPPPENPLTRVPAPILAAWRQQGSDA